MPRRLFSRPIGILYAGRYSICSALQLSEGGMLIQCEAVLSKGQNLIVSFILPGGIPVSARAEIIYETKEDFAERAVSVGHRYGVKFVPLSLQVRRSIRNYVSAKTQEEADLDLAP